MVAATGINLGTEIVAVVQDTPVRCEQRICSKLPPHAGPYTIRSFSRTGNQPWRSFETQACKLAVERLQ